MHVAVAEASISTHSDGSYALEVEVAIRSSCSIWVTDPRIHAFAAPQLWVRCGATAGLRIYQAGG